jgi:flagellar protein FliS
VSLSTAANAYRTSEVLAASPGRLVVFTFDALLSSMTRARAGAAMSNPDITIPAVGKSRELLGELLVSLDLARGGDVARRLSALYCFLLAELVSFGMHPSVTRIDRSIAIVRELREAFAQIANTPRSDVA